MRDLTKTIDYIERGLFRGLEREAALSKERRPKPSVRAWRAPATSTVYPETEQVFRPKTLSKDTPKDNLMARLTLTARALKITVPLDAAEIMALPAPDGQARSQLAVACEGKIYIADIATKSLRKAKATITASGAENVFAMVQGKLKGNEIIECGLVAQVKTPK
jgi:hypothetical protein